jgi:hypothetical protein
VVDWGGPEAFEFLTSISMLMFLSWLSLGLLPLLSGFFIVRYQLKKTRESNRLPASPKV